MIKVNSGMQLKNAIVSLERLSDATILKYTGKPKFDSANNSRDHIKQLIGRFCPKCGDGISVVKEGGTRQIRSCLTCKSKLNYRCLKCKQEYKTYDSVRAHLKFKCVLSMTNQYNHSNVHSSSSSVQCKDCGKLLTSKHVLKFHQCGEKSESLLSTSLPLPSKSADKEIKPANNNLLKLYCPECKVNIEVSKFGSKTFCPKCKSKILPQCSKCGLENTQYTKIIYHIQSKCGAEASTCNKCGTEFPSVIKLKRHLQTCGKTDIYCEHCPYKSKYQYVIRRHTITHLSQTYNCQSQEYEKQFNNEGETTDDASSTTLSLYNENLNNIKTEIDEESNDYTPTSLEPTMEQPTDFVSMPTTIYIKEEPRSPTELADNTDYSEFLPLKRKYHEVDDQLVPQVIKKWKLEPNEPWESEPSYY